jgi:hypothetical protein
MWALTWEFALVGRRFGVRYVIVRSLWGTWQVGCLWTSGRCTVGVDTTKSLTCRAGFWLAWERCSGPW